MECNSGNDLFSGENSNVIRFEDDIEFKLSGLVTAEDSVILQEIIVELNELIENVDVRFAENYGNFHDFPYSTRSEY
jgi:hypothetical protein